LTTLVGNGVSRTQLDQLIYAIFIAINAYIPIETDIHIAAGLDGAMSNILHVFHPRSEDPTVLGKNYFNKCFSLFNLPE